MTSFSNLNTGPSSNNRYAEPLVDISGSVAALRIAYATRGTGARGTPARKSLVGALRMLVSIESVEWLGLMKIEHTKRGMQNGLTGEPGMYTGYPDVLRFGFSGERG